MHIVSQQGRIMPLPFHAKATIAATNFSISTKCNYYQVTFRRDKRACYQAINKDR